MRKIISISLIVFALGGIFSSCTKTLDPGNTATVNTSNGWWVIWGDTDGNQQSAGYDFLNTYNTAENKTDSMWVDDEAFWGFKGKVALDYPNLTFTNPLSENVNYPSDAKIMNGKIFPKGGHSATGVVTDSIYFEIQFSDETDQDGNPTPYATTFTASGTRRTGFIDDDY